MTSVSNGPKRRVLLVEDNDDNMFIYQTILDRFGFEVVGETDGIRGLEAARGGGFDLILLDVSLPSRDGWEIARDLKADPATAATPIIILTAHALASDRERAAEVGANGYIAKPADPMSVVAAVRRTVEEPGYRVGLS